MWSERWRNVAPTAGNHSKVWLLKSVACWNERGASGVGTSGVESRTVMWL